MNGLTQPSCTDQPEHCLDWLQESLRLSAPHMETEVSGTIQGYNSTLVTFINNSMQLCKTNLEANSKWPSRHLWYGLVLLLLCIWLDSLSQIISKSGHRESFRSGSTISHILYTDDIKLYTKKCSELKDWAYQKAEKGTHRTDECRTDKWKQWESGYVNHGQTPQEGKIGDEKRSQW